MSSGALPQEILLGTTSKEGRFNPKWRCPRKSVVTCLYSLKSVVIISGHYLLGAEMLRESLL